ncbi:MAG: hypothetical protein H7Y15_00395 [Pseudonocardia sp.]|nr:hypothetical protein [Pseudonocardia sp.]
MGHRPQGAGRRRFGRGVELLGIRTLRDEMAMSGQCQGGFAAPAPEAGTAGGTLRALSSARYDSGHDLPKVSNMHPAVRLLIGALFVGPVLPAIVAAAQVLASSTHASPPWFDRHPELWATPLGGLVEGPEHLPPGSRIRRAWIVNGARSP